MYVLLCKFILVTVQININKHSFIHSFIDRRSGASTKHFFNLMIQFYLDNVTKLHQLTLHNTTPCPTTWRSYPDHRLLWRHFTLSILYYANGYRFHHCQSLIVFYPQLGFKPATSCKEIRIIRRVIHSAIQRPTSHYPLNESHLRQMSMKCWRNTVAACLRVATGIRSALKMVWCQKSGRNSNGITPTGTPNRGGGKFKL